MRIGILGATGFVGQNLCERLNREPGLSIFRASRRLGVDATNLPSLVSWLKLNRITHLVNLAAECGGIGRNQQSPATLWASTQLISYSVLEACRLAEIEKLIQVGTVCSYAAECPVPFREEDLMRHGLPEPTNRAYGLAKLSALVGAVAYAQQYGLRVCNLLAANMYGRYDHFDLEYAHVIPAIIHRIQDAQQVGAKSVLLWGNGKPSREFLHVSDFAEAILLALHSSDTRTGDGTFINIGTGQETPISEVACSIAQLMGFSGQILWDAARPNGQLRRQLDISRASAILGYQPKTPLSAGLVDTICWYREQMA